LAKQINLTKRAAVAVMIVAFWIAGIALLLRRNANQSEAQRLAEVALRIQPATFYYIVERDGQQIGAASSSLDTTATTLVAEEYFVGDYPAPGGKPDERTSARWQTRLTRGFRLVALTIDIARPTRPFSMSASVAEDTTLALHSLAFTDRVHARRISRHRTQAGAVGGRPDDAHRHTTGADDQSRICLYGRRQRCVLQYGLGTSASRHRSSMARRRSTARPHRLG